MDDILIVDDFFDKEQQDIIENWVSTDESMIWVHRHDPAWNEPFILKGFRDNDNDIMPPGCGAFVHRLIDQDVITNDYYQKYLSNFQSTLESKFQINVKLIHRMRVNFLLPIGVKTEKYDTPHYDSLESNCKILIYYINDSDGDTLIFNEKCYSPGTPDYTKKTLLTRVSPKKGRAVILDAFRFHSASWPSQNNRFLINVNFYI